MSSFHQKILFRELNNTYITIRFMGGMKTLLRTISVGMFARQVFTEFERIKPTNTSFSMFLAIAAKHYIDTHNEPIDVYGEVPNYYSNIDSWKFEIKKMSSEQFIKLQQRHTQLGNIIKSEVRRKI